MVILLLVFQLLFLTCLADDNNVTDVTPAEIDLRDDLSGLQTLHTIVAYTSIASSIVLYGNGAGLPVVTRQILIVKSSYCSDDLSGEIKHLFSPIDLSISNAKTNLLVGDMILLSVSFVLLYGIHMAVSRYLPGTSLVACPGSAISLFLFYVPAMFEASLHVFRNTLQNHGSVDIAVAVVFQVLMWICLLVILIKLSPCNLIAYPIFKRFPSVLLPSDPTGDLVYCSTGFLKIQKYFFGNGVWCSIRQQHGKGDSGHYLSKMKPLISDYRDIKPTRGLYVLYELTHVLIISGVTSVENTSFGTCTDKNIIIIIVLATQIILEFMYEIHNSLFMVHLNVVCAVLTLFGVVHQTISYDPVKENIIIHWASNVGVICWYCAGVLLLCKVIFEVIRFKIMYQYLPIIPIEENDNSNSEDDNMEPVSFGQLQTLTMPCSSDVEIPMTPLPPAFDQPTVASTLSEPLFSSCSRYGVTLQSPKRSFLHAPKRFHICSIASREECFFCSSKIDHLESDHVNV